MVSLSGLLHEDVVQLWGNFFFGPARVKAAEGLASSRVTDFMMKSSVPFQPLHVPLKNSKA
jgi:hypothetical protein